MRVAGGGVGAMNHAPDEIPDFPEWQHYIDGDFHTETYNTRVERRVYALARSGITGTHFVLYRCDDEDHQSFFAEWTMIHKVDSQHELNYVLVNLPSVIMMHLL